MLFSFHTNVSFAKDREVSIDSIALKAKKLKQLYLLATASSNTEAYEVQFFNEFPNTFKQLNDLYGYQNSKAAPLYYDAPHHIIELFNNLKSINDTAYYKKIISIAIGGRWDADAVNYFQNGLQKRVLDKPKLTIYTLRNKSKKAIVSFWAFYFDYESTFYRKQNYNELLKRLLSKYKASIPLITAGYNKATKEWKDVH